MCDRLPAVLFMSSEHLGNSVLYFLTDDAIAHTLLQA